MKKQITCNKRLFSLNQKAQAGLEYLMTYGWALVLIAAVLGVLVFIVSSPASTITFSSSDPTKILMKGGAVTGTDAQIKMQNITGGKIEITSVVEQGYSGCTVNGGGTPVQVGAGGQIDLECTAPSDGAGTISLEYTDFAGLPRTVVINGRGSGQGGGGASPCGNDICEAGEECSADCFAEAHCSDGADNDQDASTDCADADCFSDPACNTATLAAEYLFNEGSGPTTADSSGNGNDGTISGATWQATGCLSGSCLHFDGLSAKVEVPFNTSLAVSDDFSVSAWVKTDADPTSPFHYTFLHWRESMQWNGFHLVIRDEAGTPVVYATLCKDPSCTGYPCSSCVIGANAWHQVTVTNSSANGLRFYLDGALKQTYAFYDWTDSSESLYIGKGPYSGLVGYIDNVRLYDEDIG